MPCPMSACPHFNTCNSPVCPLDPDWAFRRHGKDDPVCRYIRDQRWLSNPHGFYRDPDTEAAPSGVTAQVVDAILIAFPRIALKAREALRSRITLESQP